MQADEHLHTPSYPWGITPTLSTHANHGFETCNKTNLETCTNYMQRLHERFSKQSNDGVHTQRQKKIRMFELVTLLCQSIVTLGDSVNNELVNMPAGMSDEETMQKGGEIVQMHDHMTDNLMQILEELRDDINDL